MTKSTGKDCEIFENYPIDIYIYNFRKNYNKTDRIARSGRKDKNKQRKQEKHTQKQTHNTTTQGQDKQR